MTLFVVVQLSYLILALIHCVMNLMYCGTGIIFKSSFE